MHANVPCVRLISRAEYEAALTIFTELIGYHSKHVTCGSDRTPPECINSASEGKAEGNVEI